MHVSYLPNRSSRVALHGYADLCVRSLARCQGYNPSVIHHHIQFKEVCIEIFEFLN